jgi:serine O-acetyltransferase
MINIKITLPRGAVRAIRNLREDVNVIRDRDPAAKSTAEVLLLYSGLHAVIAYRAAHKIYESGHPFAARALSQAARFLTGVEIHPAAKIGRRLFIDHGSGVVIGETAEIGDDCTIYQGATLGGTGKETGKRHPTLGNGVMIGAGAKLLGGFKVGDGAKIAAGAVVLSEVPPNSTAVGIPARVVRQAGQKREEHVGHPCPDLDQTHIPDPVARELCAIRLRLEKLEHAAGGGAAGCTGGSDKTNSDAGEGGFNSTAGYKADSDGGGAAPGDKADSSAGEGGFDSTAGGENTRACGNADTGNGDEGADSTADTEEENA